MFLVSRTLDFKIRVAEPNVSQEDIEEVTKALKEGCLSSGPYVEKFEQMIAEYVGVKEAIAVNSGTAALHLPLEALEIKDGDEVITTAFTFAATSNVIILQRAKPVFVDIESETYNLDPKKIENSITSKTKAIMPIHYAGQCAEMEEILEIADKHSLHVIEDAAPALGAIHNKKKAGTFGEASGLSFFPDKNMTTGEGGMILTNNLELADKCRILRKNGASERYYNTMIGWNFKMPDLNAALGLSQLKRIETIIEAKNQKAAYYSKNLNLISDVNIPIVRKYNRSTFMLYPIVVKDTMQRDKIKENLFNNGVETRINFPPMHLQPIYQKLFGFKKGMLKITEDIADRILGLPIFINMTQEQQDFVIKIIKDSVEK